MAPWIWLVIAVALCAAEALSGDFVLLMLGFGALTGVATAAITDELWIQLVVFAACSVALVFLARPMLLRHFHRTPPIPTGMEAVIGAHALTVEQVTSGGGLVKIGGETWSAVSSDGRIIPTGSTVTVLAIRGATVVVNWS